GHSLLKLAHLLEAVGPGAGPAEVNRAARHLARCLKGAVRRTLSPIFPFVAACIDRARAVGDSGAWTLERRAVAEAIVLHGRSERDAATTLDIPPHRVRAHRRAVEAMFVGASS